MFNWKDIGQIHLEMTDRCNASCAQCARNILGGKENPNLSQAELTLEDIKIIFPKDVLAHLKRIYMCGNYGDPIVARDCLDAFDYFRNMNLEIDLGLNTNGGARNKKWWSDLAGIFDRKGEVKFGIDGLVDTNHLYRRNVDFKKVIDNASSFISNGGNAVWEYIVFRHNEHQIEEARSLAKELGFKKFTLKKTGRFFSNSKLEGILRQEVHNNDGDIEYYLELPSQEQYQNQSLRKENELIRSYGSLMNYLDMTQVSCKTLNEGSLYVSSEGLLFPCCWTANQLYLWYNQPKTSNIWKLIEKSGGKENLNLRNQGFDEILKGKFFNYIISSWTCSSIENGKLRVCAKTCGSKFNQFKDQYK